MRLSEGPMRDGRLRLLGTLNAPSIPETCRMRAKFTPEHIVPSELPALLLSL